MIYLSLENYVSISDRDYTHFLHTSTEEDELLIYNDNTLDWADDWI